MKLVFIHGINNQRHLPSNVVWRWWGQIQRGWQMLGLPNISQPPTAVGYYAQRLYFATSEKTWGHPDPDNELPIFDRERTFQMGEDASFSADSYAFGMLKEYCDAAGVDFPQDGELTEQGFVRSSGIWLIDKVQDVLWSKSSKNISRPLLRQAAVWADNRGLRDGLQNQIVNMMSGNRNAHDPAGNIGTEPLVIVSHSLGTALAYRLLMNEELTEGASVPLFITMGSPLPVKFIRKALDEAELYFPDFVERWINVYDTDDFVPVGSPLKEKDLGFEGYENYQGIMQEGDEDPHSVAAHLRHPEIARALHKVLS